MFDPAPSDLDVIWLTTSRKHRRVLYQAAFFGGRCAYCSRKPRIFTLDHVIPQSEATLEVWGNSVPACLECNVGKGTQSLDQFLKGKPKRLKRIKEWLQETSKPNSRIRVAYREGTKCQSTQILKSLLAS
jgi:5-methylcytosine-specific restriction endonuclease McrA